MEEKEKKLIVILNESVIGSLLKDAGSFILFGGLMLFNHTYLSGNGWIDAIFILIVILWLSTRNSARVFSGSKEDAIKWLQEKSKR